MKNKSIVIGNWKMALGVQESAELAKQVAAASKALNKTLVGVAPSAMCIPAVKSAVSEDVMVGTQNVHWEDKGAFTGEISIPQVRELNLSFVIVGHSERRHLFFESEELVAKRALGALSKGVRVVFCVGETLNERESNQTTSVLNRQLAPLLEQADTSWQENLVVAYEPVWAIGTGKVANITDIVEAHTFINQQVEQKFGSSCPILYGGSVKPANFKEILALDLVQGGLVGGASLDPNQFAELIRIAEQI